MKLKLLGGSVLLAWMIWTIWATSCGRTEHGAREGESSIRSREEERQDRRREQQQEDADFKAREIAALERIANALERR